MRKLIDCYPKEFLDTVLTHYYESVIVDLDDWDDYESQVNALMGLSYDLGLKELSNHIESEFTEACQDNAKYMLDQYEAHQDHLTDVAKGK